jgi:hypothetical protein
VAGNAIHAVIAETIQMRNALLRLLKRGVATHAFGFNDRGGCGRLGDFVRHNRAPIWVPGSARHHAIRPESIWPIAVGKVRVAQGTKFGAIHGERGEQSRQSQ